jgi:two-component system response regulator MprA
MQTESPLPATKRILCVDDDPRALTITRALLQTKGYQVETADCGACAVNQINQQFDLLILDYNLPDFNGDVVAERFRQEHPSVPILMYSGSSQLPEHALACVNAHLAKGSGVESLFGAVSALTSPAPRSYSAAAA